jgi:tetratricopeptide (TPR) repeat protein
MMIPILLSAVLWSTDLNDALRQAHAERKVTIVHAAQSPSAKLDEALARESVSRMTPAFVFARSADRRYRGSAELLVVTSAGDVAARLEGTLDANRVYGFLQEMAELAPVIVAAGEQRAKGNDGDADLALAFVQLVHEPGATRLESQAPFRRAERAFERAGDREGEERAHLWWEMFEMKGRFAIRNTIEETKSARNAAEGWLILGLLYDRERSLSAAADAYRKAVAIAPSDSNTAVVARYALVSQKERMRRGKWWR